jgi:hypothetical protein
VISTRGGNGVDFFVDLGDSSGNLASGSLFNSSTSLVQISDVDVSPGDRIHFIVGPGGSGDNTFDATRLRASIVLREEAPFTGITGDCNGDEIVDAADFMALELEIGDGDGDLVADVGGGTFAGSPGCDANTDDRVDTDDRQSLFDLYFAP